MEKDKFYGKTALILSLGFFIPMFNIGLSIVSIWLALKALRKVDENPKKYGGRKYAVAALVISVMTVILTVFGTAIYAFEKLRC